jgi:hypothetical protein
VPTGDGGDLIVGCDSGTLVSGGVSIAEILVNIFVLRDAPTQGSGAPTSWEGEVANTSGSTATMSVKVVCATQPGSGASAAAQAQGARIVKKTVTPLPNTQS